MNLADRFVDAFDSIFLTLVMVWFVGVGATLAQPDTTRERHGVVEIYSLVAADDAQSGV